MEVIQTAMPSRETTMAGLNPSTLVEVAPAVESDLAKSVDPSWKPRNKGKSK
jgi:hypothetical protein